MFQPKRLMITLALCSLIAAGNSGCRRVLQAPDNNDSQGKINIGTHDALQIESLEPWQKKSICESTTMVVFVGNAEAQNEIRFAPVLLNSTVPAVKESVAKLKESVEKSRREYFGFVKSAERKLFAALARPVPCEKGSGSVLALSIVDGPGFNDTSITIKKFGWDNNAWGEIKLATSDYAFVDGNVIPKTGPFEINLPATLRTIIDRTIEKFGKSDQIVYLLKGHGGKLAPNGFPVPALQDFQRVGESAKGTSHAFLFDTHGENNKLLSSNIYGIGWTQNAACGIFKKHNMPCPDDTGGVTNPQRSAGQGQNGSASQGQNGSASQGQNGSSSQGQNGSSSQGQEGNPSQGQDGSSSQGQEGNPSQGSGKFLIFRGQRDANGNWPTALTQAPTDDLPEFYLEYGDAAAYDPTFTARDYAAAGLERILLPAGAQGTYKPTMIVMDTCYGLESVVNAVDAKAFFNASPPKESANFLPVVVLSNEKPTYFLTVHYELLDSALISSLGPLLLWVSPVGNTVNYPNFDGNSPNNEAAQQITVQIMTALQTPAEEERAIISSRLKVPREKVEGDYLKFNIAVSKATP